jgi:large subunit ribosomal protein L2
MKFKRHTCITSGTRHQLNLNKNSLSKTSKLVKQLSFNTQRFVGRSSQTGHITVRARGSGVKYAYRNICPIATNNLGVVICTFFDPNKSSFTSLSFDLLKYKFYLITAVSSVYTGSIISYAPKFLDLKLGYRLCLSNIPVGVIISTISLSNKIKPLFARAAGTFCQLLQRTALLSFIRLPSMEIISISNLGYAAVGVVSNFLNNRIVLGKAGKNRLSGFRSKVRGIAMNPVDHPHGGRTNGGIPSVSPWAKLAKGKPTVKKKRIFKL